MERICLIAMKGTLDRIDALLERDPMKTVGPHFNGPFNVPSLHPGQLVMQDGKAMISHAELKSIRDDLWAAWFELKDKVK